MRRNRTVAGCAAFAAMLLASIAAGCGDGNGQSTETTPGPPAQTTTSGGASGAETLADCMRRAEEAADPETTKEACRLAEQQRQKCLLAAKSIPDPAERQRFEDDCKAGR